MSGKERERVVPIKPSALWSPRLEEWNTLRGCMAYHFSRARFQKLLGNDESSAHHSNVARMLHEHLDCYHALELEVAIFLNAHLEKFADPTPPGDES